MQVEGKLRSRIREKKKQWGIKRMMKLRVRIYHEGYRICHMFISKKSKRSRRMPST